MAKWLAITQFCRNSSEYEFVEYDYNERQILSYVAGKDNFLKFSLKFFNKNLKGLMCTFLKFTIVFVICGNNSCHCKLTLPLFALNS